MRISKYTPSLLDPKDLEAIFVQRHRLAEQLVDLVSDSALSKSKHYSLLIGPRGIGKTHLISLLYHRVVAKEELKTSLAIAWLREEEWGISSFLDLVLRILRSLYEAYPESKLEEKAAELYETSPQLVEKHAIQLLQEFLGERALLLLMENMDDIFQGLGDEGQKKLRSFLQETGCCTIIATSQSLFNGVKLQTSPFYGFFRIRYLKDFSVDEAVALLRIIAEIEGNQELVAFLASSEGRSRMQTVHHLAGGNPRIYVVFSEFLTSESLDDLIEPFIQMLDDLTPYYQARMSWLSPQQRKIIEVLCSCRYALPVKDIAKQCFATPQTISSQLKDLKEKGYVLSETYGRQAFYELREPLMRICLAIKQVRGEPIKLIVEFLRTWYSRQKLKEMSHRLDRQMMVRNELADNTQDFLWQEYLRLALDEQVEIGSDPRIEACLEECLKDFNLGSYESSLEQSKKLVHLRGNSFDFLCLAACRVKLGHYEEAIASYENVLEINPESYVAWSNRGIALEKVGHYEEAIASYEKALEINPESYAVWGNRGDALTSFGHYEEAIANYRKALNINPAYIPVLGNLGNLFTSLGHYEEAIASYEKVLAINPQDVLAWGNRGIVLDNAGRYEESIASYEKALEINPEYFQAWGNYGILLKKLSRYEEAIASYEKALEINSKDVIVWVNLGIALDKMGRYEEAVTSYEKALEINPEDIPAWVGLGIALDKTGHYEEAIASLNEALEIDPKYAFASINKGFALCGLGRYEEAITSFDEALSLGLDKTMARMVKLRRAELHFALNLSKNSFQALETEIESVSKADLTDVNWSFEIGLHSIFQHSQDPLKWKQWLRSILQMTKKNSLLDSLGNSLCQQLKKLVPDIVSQTAAESWRDVWQELVGDRPEFQIPLRLLNAVVEYKKAPDDPRVFLSLAIEERKILQQLLGVGADHPTSV